MSIEVIIVKGARNDNLSFKEERKMRISSSEIKVGSFVLNSSGDRCKVSQILTNQDGNTYLLLENSFGGFDLVIPGEEEPDAIFEERSEVLSILDEKRKLVEEAWRIDAREGELDEKLKKYAIQEDDIVK